MMARAGVLLLLLLLLLLPPLLCQMLPPLLCQVLAVLVMAEGTDAARKRGRAVVKCRPRIRHTAIRCAAC